MRLTQFSNFAVRVLMYAGLSAPRLCTLPQMARAYGVSYDHLKKAAAELSRLGYLQTVRGRTGGFRLAMRPEEIRIGTVIRQMEGEIILVECFEEESSTCPLVNACRLRVALREALVAFFDVLDRYTLADLIGEPAALAPLLSLPQPAEPRAGDRAVGQWGRAAERANRRGETTAGRYFGRDRV